MAFRNEEAALRARIAVLEREVASLRDAAEERDRLKARVAQLESQLGIDQERKRRAAEERAAAQRREREALVSRVRRSGPSAGVLLPLAAGGLVLAGVAGWVLSSGEGIGGPSLTAPPSVGMVDLDVTAEPALPVMETRGSSSPPPGCRGWIPSAPQLVLRSSSPVALRVGATPTAGEDLVLVLIGPDGRVACDDDSGHGNAPLLTTVLPPGDSRVWVGTYSEGQSSELHLSIAAHPVAAIPDATGLASSAPATAGVLDGPDAAQAFAGTARALVEARTLDTSCRGYVPVEPQGEIRLAREAAVRVHARSPGLDLVLLVRTADGRVLCDDDSGPGNEPLVATLLGPGVHRVWVGSYRELSGPFEFTLDASAYGVAADGPVARTLWAPTR